MKKSLLLSAAVLLGLSAFGQEFPRFEIAALYSFARYAPSATYTHGHSLNGGGGQLTVNFTENLGIKMDLVGYGSTQTVFTLPRGSALLPAGGTIRGNGNLFTYMFGPQIKSRSEKVQPYFHLLFGAAHSNVYASAYTNAGGSRSGAPSGDAFAMAFGGGVDIPVSNMVAIRVGQVDYLLTRFTNQFTNSNQNNFRYSAGIVLHLGNR